MNKKERSTSTFNKGEEYFTGHIIQRLRQKVYDKKSPFYQQVNYKLIIKEYQQEITIFVHTNKINPEILNIIEQKVYLDKKYRFITQRSKWGWILLDWQEINY